MFGTSCAATVCFIPSILIQAPAAEHQPVIWPIELTSQIKIAAPTITVTALETTRELTSVERTVFHAALRRSVKKIASGSLASSQ